MPYRGLEHSGPACYRHDAAPATETCTGCLQAICDICVGFEDTRPHCPPCARRVRRRRAAGRALTGALSLFLVSGAMAGMGYLAARDRPFDYGHHLAQVRAMEERLSSEPCGRAATLKLTETMLRAGDHRGTLKKIDEFHERCGEWSRLGWVSYSAHMRLGEHEAAIADASRLIELSPNDKDFWWWRAQAWEETGHLDHAVADYRKALDIEPTLTGIPFNLASVLERQGKLCEAREPLEQFLLYHANVRDREHVVARLERLSRNGHCNAQNN